jgi:hypothetical protein
MQFFDHRREYARTDWENDGRPKPPRRDLISEKERRPRSRPGHLRYGLPKSSGGQAASNLAIAAIREHLAAKGLGLRNDSQDRSSIIGGLLFGISFGYEDPRRLMTRASNERGLTMSYASIADPGPGRSRRR